MKKNPADNMTRHGDGKFKGKKRSFLRTLKRTFYVIIIMAFVVLALYIFVQANAFTDSLAGRATIKSTQLAADTLIDRASPQVLLFGAIVGCVGYVYLLRKHFLIVGMASAVVAGVVMAVVL